jgi:hypothetical protein
MIEDRARFGLRFEHGPGGNLGIPFHRGRKGAAAADDNVEEGPDRAGDRAVVAVDEQFAPVIVHLLGMPAQVNLADLPERKVVQVIERRDAVMDRRDENIVDVQQQPAALPPGRRADKNPCRSSSSPRRARRSTGA